MRSRLPPLLCLYYFAFFAAAGIYAPYLGLYTRGLGFSSLQVGILAALTPLSKILFPPFWGGIADRSGGRKGLILLSTVLSVAAFSLLFKVAAFTPVAIALLFYAFFHSPILALSEALVLEEAARGGFAYGRVRAWGSVGYLLAAGVLGKILDLTTMRTFVTAFVVVTVFQLFTASALPSVVVPKASRSARGILDQLRRREVLLFIGVCTLMEVSHSGYNGFFAVYLSESGYTKTLIGGLLALPVLSEIGAMLVADRWLSRRGTRAMMGTAFTAAGVRWLLLASSVSLLPVIASQGLHALTYGVFHVTAVHQARRLFPASLQASAQSLYIGLTYGLGGAAGLVAAGRLYDQVGARWLFFLSSLVAFMTLPVALRMSDPQADSGRAEGT